jgi:hypothetical protein
LNQGRSQDLVRDITKESIIEQTYCSENLPQPLFAKEGKFFPFEREGRRDLVSRVYTILD